MENVSRQSDAPAKAKRHIRNYLIDADFQLRWVFRVTLVIAIIVAIMGYFVYRTVADATDQMVAQKIGDMELTKESVEAFIATAESDKTTTLYTLVGWLCGLVLMLGLSTIVLTHRIAGPVYKMRRIFRMINGDDLRLWEKLRKADELHEVFDEFGDMLSRLREHRRKDTEDLVAIRRAIEESGVSEGVTVKLDEIIKRYKESVKMT